MENKVYKVYGNKGIVYGDLHISDKYKGKHKNYLENCFSVMADILNECRRERPSFIVFLGDVVGLNDKLIKHREVLLQLCNFFTELNNITNKNVFVIRGNHDMGEFPEFDFLVGLKLFNTADTIGKYFDYYAKETDEVPQIRFHLIDYGKEREPVELYKGDVTNVGLAHNNFVIQGLTTWYNQHDGLELCRMNNLRGIDFLISGHIHNPSPQLISTQMLGGGECSLFYPGCATRPSADQGKYESVWSVYFVYDELENVVDWDAKPFNLRPAEEVFYEDDAFLTDKTEEEIAEDLRKENLAEVLNDITKYHITSGDVFNQVRCIPNATDNAKDIACRYLQLAYDSSSK